MNIYINNQDQIDIIEHYGIDNQLGIHMEECAELIQAVSKLNRGWRANDDYFKARDQVAEEIADVIVCISQLQIILGLDDEDIEQIVKAKLRRQKGRMLTEMTGRENKMPFE